MTNKEIRKSLERDIVLKGSVKDAFNYLVSQNAECILKQAKKITTDESFILYTANISVSISIGNYKSAGILRKLYDGVLLYETENVVEDKIMEYAINKVSELVLVQGVYFT